MDVQKLWVLQLQDMEAEDRHHEYIRHNTFYPNGLFNLTSNPFFTSLVIGKGSVQSIMYY